LDGKHGTDVQPRFEAADFEEERMDAETKNARRSTPESGRPWGVVKAVAALSPLQVAGGSRVGGMVSDST
jgi:hypothetical protein